MIDCLIIDDEMDLVDSTASYFQLFDITVDVAYSLSDFHEIYEPGKYKMLLLDINLGDGSGFALCKELRDQGDETPILFISARTSEHDQVMALSIGGDDFIAKPYSLSVLLAKVRLVLKRLSKQDQENIYENASFRVDLNQCRVYKNGIEIPLKAMEYKLLEYFIENRNRVLSKDEIFDHVWEDSFTSDGTLNVHVHHLREHLEENPKDPKYIKTVWRRGYIFEDEEESE